MEQDMTPEELTSHEQEQASAVREILSSCQEFRPFAVFDQPLDCIRVITRDCSVTEIRIDDFLTVLEANYPVSGSDEYVGFTIKGVAHLCESHGIPASGPWKLADFLDAILTASSEPVARPIVQKVARPIVEENQLLEVERIAA
jgi:hypothetical protein